MIEPTKLSFAHPESERLLYKVVRRDTMEDVPGLILLASVESGACFLRGADGSNKEFEFGPDGLRIVRR
jgi:hypothetical protein